MGGRSSSATATTNNVDSSTKNFDLGAAEIAVVGSENRISTTNNTLDSGAINAAFEFGGKSLGVVSDALGAVNANNKNAFNFSSESSARAFEFGAGSVDAAFSLSKSIAEKSTEQANDALSKSINAANSQSAAAYQFATSVARPNDQNTANLRIMAYAGAAIAVALIFAKYSR